MGKPAKFDVILQGGGRMVLAFLDPNITPDEVGAFKVEFEKMVLAGGPITAVAGAGQIIDNRPANEQTLTKITTVDRSSGRYHERWIEVQLDGNERMLTDERCQADQSGRFEVLPVVPDSADENTLCRYCFPGVPNG